MYGHCVETALFLGENDDFKLGLRELPRIHERIDAQKVVTFPPTNAKGIAEILGIRHGRVTTQELAVFCGFTRLGGRIQTKRMHIGWTTTTFAQLNILTGHSVTQCQVLHRVSLTQRLTIILARRKVGLFVTAMNNLDTVHDPIVRTTFFGGKCAVVGANDIARRVTHAVDLLLGAAVDGTSFASVTFG